jgi:hypothetical protein
MTNFLDFQKFKFVFSYLESGYFVLKLVHGLVSYQLVEFGSLVTSLLGHALNTVCSLCCDLLDTLKPLKMA